MPAYRGLVLRGAGPQAGRAVLLRPGDRLVDRSAVSAVVPGSRSPLPGGACYAVWSVTGQLIRRPSGDHDEVVFRPGTPFRVLDIRLDTPSPLFLLRELPGPDRTGTPSARQDAPSVLDDLDRAVLGRLDEALRGLSSPSGKAAWPQRCAGPIGNGP
jgi:hypothetical protein